MTMRVWNGTNGSWSTASNWSPAGVPGPGDVADITAGVVDANGVDLSRRKIVINAIRGDITTGLTVDNTSLGVGAGGITYLNGIGNVAFLTLNNAVTDGVIVARQGPAEVYVNANQTAVNRGWWTIGSTTGSSITTYAYGQFINAGGIEASAHGSYTLSFEGDQVNYGNYQVDPGGGMTFYSGNHTPATYNWMGNFGALTVNGGTMWMGANVWQAGAGNITVTGNGVLTLTGETDGGTIQINSGMLTFAPTQFTPGPIGASKLNSNISFTGQSGEINLGEAIRSATYNAATNDIRVMVPWKGYQVQAADFHLAGSYAANQFTYDLSKGLIDFHRTPTA
jgi:hypothetical protein